MLKFAQVPSSGQEIGLGGKKLSVKLSRFTVIAGIVGLLGATGLVLWRRSGTAPPPDDTPRRGRQIVGSIRADPRTFNRLVARDQTTLVLTLLMQGTLVRVNRASGELEPWLAESWESNEDGRVHTVHLRPGMSWSDGTPLTSADVLFSVEAVFDP